MQIVRELANVPRQRERLLLKVHEFLLQLLTDAILAQPLLEAAERDRDTRQLLAHVIVQVSCNTRPLGILRLDQPSGQMLNLSMTLLQRGAALANPVLGVPPLGDVHIAADIPGKAAVRAVLRNARRQQPPVAAVGVANAVFHEEWLARFERGLVGVTAAVQVLRMDTVQPALVQQLFERPSSELHTSVIEVVERRVWSGGPDHDGCAIRDETNPLLALAQRPRGAHAARQLVQRERQSPRPG